MKKTKSFKYWTSEEVEKTFALKRMRTTVALNTWLQADGIVLSEKERTYIEALRENLIDQIEYWNEEELKYHFLGKFVDLINFESPERYRSFLGRTLSTEINGMMLSGEVDFMVATGKQTPQNPFFFLHEYKQGLKRDNDPLGQVLIAMVVARAKNNDKKPVYGCYVTGRFWYFVVLEENQYAVSDALKATDEEIIQIATIIKKSKEHIEATLTEIGI